MFGHNLKGNVRQKFRGRSTANEGRKCKEKVLCKLDLEQPIELGLGKMRRQDK